MDPYEAMIRHHFERLAAGDAAGAVEGLAEDFVQDWPQSGERLHGREACFNVNRNYPGGPPTGVFRRILGDGDVRVAELEMRYGDTKSFVTSVFEFRDGQIVHETDWFGEPFPAPAWRSEWVEIAD
jgi:ketosteroid isomerase-like protein